MRRTGFGLRTASVCLVIAGCGFNPAGDGGGGDDAAGDGPDVIVDAAIDAGPTDVVYLPPQAETPGTGDWDISGLVSLDTSPAAQRPQVPDGVTFTSSMQTDPGGGEVLVVHVAALTIEEGGTLSLYGTRPLVIVAGGPVLIDGEIDAAAVGSVVTGPGGSLPAMGPGAGMHGTHASGDGALADSGGGGGGYLTSGASGGPATCVTACSAPTAIIGAPGGTTYNQPPTRLIGGSGGGLGADVATCPNAAGGAGGGAIMIYSPVSIRIGAGLVHAGGGGGSGGARCVNVATTAGSGGGAGGQIDLQSPSIAVTGTIAATGGAGGAGAASGLSAGQAGEDAHHDGTLALGAPSAGITSGAGGDGGTTAAPLPGSDGGNDGNGGGGGGAAGRIVIHYRGAQPTVTSTPPPLFIPY